MLKKLLIIIYFGIIIISCKSETKLNDPLNAGWKGKKVCNILEENEKIRVLKCIFHKGVGHEKHYHNPHFGYTLKGSTFKIKDNSGIREVNVPTNYSFYNKDIVIHEVENIGDSIAVFLIIEPK